MLAAYRAPKDKVTLIVNTCRLVESQLRQLVYAAEARARIDESVNCTRRQDLRLIGADDFFPVLVYVIVQVSSVSVMSDPISGRGRVPRAWPSHVKWGI